MSFVFLSTEISDGIEGDGTVRVLVAPSPSPVWQGRNCFCILINGKSKVVWVMETAVAKGGGCGS